MVSIRCEEAGNHQQERPHRPGDLVSVLSGLATPRRGEAVPARVDRTFEIVASGAAICKLMLLMGLHDGSS